LDASEGRRDQSREFLVAPREIAEVVGDEPDGVVNRGKSFMALLVELNLMIEVRLYKKFLSVFKGFFLDIEPDHAAKTACQKKGVMPIAAGGVDRPVARLCHLLPEGMG